MAELLLELLSEEIPARMQARAESDLARLLEKAFRDAGLDHSDIATYSTPRRLTAHVADLAEQTPDLSEERRGPRTDAPDKAVEGFTRSLPAGTDVTERETEKGTFLFARIEQPGRATIDILEDIIPPVIEGFPWPKSMRWGTTTFRWVRPLRFMLCIFGEAHPNIQAKIAKISGKDPNLPDPWEGEEPMVSGYKTLGHPFMAPDIIEVTDFDDYKQKLEAAKVILDPGARRDRIREKAETLAREAGLDLVDDEAMIAENAGLTEWPVPLLGRFDESYLDVPEEALISAMRNHQKYLTLRDPKTGRLAPYFICVANIEAPDGGKQIVAGNERVLSARLADARFFWDEDRKVPLENRIAGLDGIVFHEKLGSLGERVKRIEELAASIAENYVEAADPEQVRRAARLCKADLVTGMVGEFPDLQGVMGRYYALEQGEPAPVARAIAEHYAPKGPDDACPTDPVAVSVALAEKIDTLVGFFGIDERPTGSKDPYALRRAALGAIRLIVENDLRIQLFLLLADAHRFYADRNDAVKPHDFNILDFFADRLKVQQRAQGVRHDLIDAVFSLGGEDDLVRMLARVRALQEFLKSEDGENLLAAYRRAGNIVRIEEKKDKTDYEGDVDPALLTEPQEKALFERLGAAAGEAEAAVRIEDFEDAMRALATLRDPIDAFFDTVTVNIDDADIRANRLRLLSAIRASMNRVANFSKIESV